MTRIIEDPGGTPPSGLAEQELLQKLIKEGLAPSDDRGETDVTRYRKLVEVLFQACILNPVNQPVTPSSLEQAGYTLTILSRQSIARPELLSCLPPSTELQIPLYKWIIPRLVYAAMRYEEKEGAAGLVEDLSSAALHVLLVLGRDLSDEETSFAKGPRRVLLALKYMVDFCQGRPFRKEHRSSTEIVEGRSSLLFGYPACPSNPVALLFILDIVFRARPAFADQVGMTACLQLVEASRFVKHHVHRQTRYALTVLTALDAFPSRRILIPACVAIMCWPISNDGKWQSAVDAVSRALPKLETPMRLHISRALRGRSDRLHIVQGASSGLLNDPFDPLEDPSALNTVDELIPNLRLERKYDQSKGSDIQSVPTARPVPRQILVSEDRDPQSSRKRKRDGVLDDTEIRQILTERIPKLSLAQGDVIHALTECLRT